MKPNPVPAVILLTVSLIMFGCDKKADRTLDSREAAADQTIRQKYGKSLDELPTAKLVAISPHNTDIENEFEKAFSLHHAVEYGQKVIIEWRDVGGGSSAILHYLRNVYQNSDHSGIDIVWGGGDYNFGKMADEGILREMTIAPDVLQNIPANFGGLKMYDPQKRWCGSALSGFGFFYNKQLLDRLELPGPVHWGDLGNPGLYDLVGLADPMLSGSAAASYEMIVQSAVSWPAGWAKLLSILGNAKKFYAGAGDAAEAVPSGEVAVTTCVDFYGTNRVAKYPDMLVYVSPKGQTAFNADPIGILKNPPNRLLAQRMADFVLSREGQALWALPAGHADGPARVSLGRQPIRKDIYEIYAGDLLPAIVNPYAFGQGMNLDRELWSISYGLLRQLVWAAAVKNLDGLKAARKKLIDTGFETDRLAEFNRLPVNVATQEAIRKTNPLLSDKKQQDIIVTDWITFFRNKYRKIAAQGEVE